MQYHIKNIALGHFWTVKVCNNKKLKPTAQTIKTQTDCMHFNPSSAQKFCTFSYTCLCSFSSSYTVCYYNYCKGRIAALMHKPHAHNMLGGLWRHNAQPIVDIL